MDEKTTPPIPEDPIPETPAPEETAPEAAAPAESVPEEPVSAEAVPEKTAFPDPAMPESSVIPQKADDPVSAASADSIPEGKLPEMPDIPEVPEDSALISGSAPESAFYGDPHAPVTQPARYDYTYTYLNPPHLPSSAPVPVMNRRIYTMSAVIAVLIFLLCLFCIISDLIKGVSGSMGSDGGTVNVIIRTQPKPDLDPEDLNVTADGTYTVRGVAELVKPSIVEVYAYTDEVLAEEFLNGTGSGIIISEDGYIITNAHVAEGDSFRVVLDDNTEYEAVLVGGDHKTDLAVLKIDADGLTAATLGDSDELYVGEDVVAIGNPAGLTNTVTKGIISALNRQVRADDTAFVMDCIQTDAAISPGNSGGALVNMYGQVIGITSSKYASGYVTGNIYEGLGFAITINQALPIVQDLMSQGYVSGRFRIGISFFEVNTESAHYYYQEDYGKDIPEEISGLWVREISEDCDISNTDLRADDFIETINGVPVESYDDVQEVLDGFKGGDLVTADCARVEEDGSITYFTIEFKLEVDTSGNF